MVTLNGNAPLAISTGAKFAEAYRKNGVKTVVNYDYTITEEFKPGENRSRIAMISWIMPRRKLSSDDIVYWSERRVSGDKDEGNGGLRRWREFRVAFGADIAVMQPIRAWVLVPPEILADPDMVADFIDYRLIPRLGTVENQEVLLGKQGILRHPELSRLPYRGTFADGLMEICNEVEQNAATAHVLVLNPKDYYRSLVGGGHLLANMQANGNVVIRTRMIASGCALVGDFNVAVRFLHQGRSVIRFGSPPDGDLNHDTLALWAETIVGISVNLPTHLYHMMPEAGPRL